MRQKAGLTFIAVFLSVLWCCSPSTSNVRADKLWWRVLEILLISSWMGRRVGKQRKGNLYLKPTQKNLWVCLQIPDSGDEASISCNSGSSSAWNGRGEGSILPRVWVWNCNRRFHKLLSAQMSWCWLSAPFSAAENSRWEGQKQWRSLFNSQIEKSRNSLQSNSTSDYYEWYFRDPILEITITLLYT